MLRLFARCCDSRVNFRYPQLVRTFLSEAYKCTDLWSQRLNSPILQKVRVEELYNTIDQKFSRNEVVSAIDIDIFANSVSNENYLNELRDLLLKLRLSIETMNTLDSTKYATARIFIETGKYDELVEILDDRLNYGIFLNEFTGNILLDELIKFNNFSVASKVASFFMLQESFENNEITENLCIFACMKYLANLKPEVIEVKEEVSDEKPVKKKKEEEVKIRVSYLRNPYFDDHFDLTDLKLLTGKTLAMASSKYSDTFNLNCQLLGWLFYKKVEKVKKISKLIQDNNALLNDCLQLFKGAMELSHIKDDPEILNSYSEIYFELEKSNCLDKTHSTMDEIITEKIKDAINKLEQENIDRHSQLFSEWDQKREFLLMEQLKRLENEKFTSEKKAKVEELRLLDEKIWFFDNQEKFELKIKNRELPEPKYPVKVKKSSKLDDEHYIPPEIKPQPSKH